MVKIRKSILKLNKLRPKDSSAEIRRLGVIVERIDDNVKLIAEQYGDVKKTLDSHTRILDSHTEMIGGLATDLSDVRSKLDSHTRILDSHTEMIGGLATDLGIVKEDAEFTKNSLKRKVDVEEFAALEKRVSALERRR
ncbi:MAG TPA: hypothetical protein VMU70_02510 [Candidatus Tyrphobacter sp.]|nr:hypothetical protein [Candidatus Tyrphobacter sp.]